MIGHTAQLDLKLFIAVMAKINRISRKAPSFHKVRIFVEDPHNIYSIGGNISFMKVLKASNVNAAIRAASTYCNKQMKEYPNVTFKYSLDEIVPYNYFEYIFQKEE